MLLFPTTPRKLRKLPPVTSTPPVLAPIVLHNGPLLDLDHIFLDPQPSRRLTKRRIPHDHSLPSSSSAAAAAAAATGNPATNISATSQVASHPTPHRSHSDPTRRSIIKKLSLRSPSFSSPPAPSSFSRWSRRRSPPPHSAPLLPLVRATSPFTVDMPRATTFMLDSDSSNLSSPTDTLASYPLSHSTHRRYTFAMAMTNDDITDETLVEQLERICLRKNHLDQLDDFWDLDHLLFRSLQSSFPSLPDSTSTHQWHTARRLLLTCRELLRTERHYLVSLQALLSSQTHGSPPPLMLTYVDQLVKLSQSYLASMLSDPSSSGVATAFLHVEQPMDNVFVRWCSVVGLWFDNTKDNSRPCSRKLTKPCKCLNDELKDPEQDEHDQDEHEDDPLAGSRLKINSWRRSLASLTDLATNTQKKDKTLLLQPPINGKPKKPSIRDLAILPTQRIMRYVLLYRDLLTHTPSTSPSHDLVQRAADAAFRIAQKCDRAQTNSAFIVNTPHKVPKPAVAPALSVSA